MAGPTSTNCVNKPHTGCVQCKHRPVTCTFALCSMWLSFTVQLFVNDQQLIWDNTIWVIILFCLKFGLTYFMDPCLYMYLEKVSNLIRYICNSTVCNSSYHTSNFQHIWAKNSVLLARRYTSTCPGLVKITRGQAKINLPCPYGQVTLYTFFYK